MKNNERLIVGLAIQRELKKNPKIKTLLYLQEHGETSAYKIAKAFEWEPSKAHAIIKQLEHSKSIKSKRDTINGRAVKLVSLVED
ncbi:MAG: MarR family winged helix-turn-helix transcriptional regulator [Candidatus Micrarchaeota archaeon]